MGNQCQSKHRKKERIKTYDQSGIVFDFTSILEGMLTTLSCPIDNIKITDRKRQIDSNYPFSISYVRNTPEPTTKMVWK